jgi:hypothetical protein
MLRRASRTSDFTWRYSFNLGRSFSYAFSRPALSTEGARVLDDLNRDGIAATTVDKLLGAESSFADLEQFVEAIERDRKVEIAEARAEGNNLAQKNYLYQIICPSHKNEDYKILEEFGKQAAFQNIADAYYGLKSSLSYYNVWHTFVTKGGPTQSQLWHRDPEDRYILKIFVHLTDVDKSSGPFTYARGTHVKGGAKIDPGYFIENDGGKRTTDEQMLQVVAQERWYEATGPKGTIILADTRGYHKGGLARGKERILFNCMYL